MAWYLAKHSDNFIFIFNSSPNISIVIKSRRMRWAGHLERMGELRNAYKILVGKT
jgi:hypothetical protein